MQYRVAEEDASMLSEQDADPDSLQQEDRTMPAESTLDSTKAVIESVEVNDSSTWIDDGIQSIDEEAADLRITANDFDDLEQVEEPDEKDVVFPEEAKSTESMNQEDTLALPRVSGASDRPSGLSKIQFGDLVDSDDENTMSKESRSRGEDFSIQGRFLYLV